MSTEWMSQKEHYALSAKEIQNGIERLIAGQPLIAAVQAMMTCLVDLANFSGQTKEGLLKSMENVYDILNLREAVKNGIKHQG